MYASPDMLCILSTVSLVVPELYSRKVKNDSPIYELKGK